MDIVWRPQAADDLAAARTFIAQYNPIAAERVFGRILESVEQLKDMPYLGRIGRVPGTRELVVYRTPYIVAYFVAGDHIEIAAVMHGARKWPDRF